MKQAMIASYCNYILNHYSGGNQCQGDYTLTGDRNVPIADIIHNLMLKSSEYEVVDEGFADESRVVGAIFWHKNIHWIIILREGEWVIGRMPEGERIPQSNYGYYYVPNPESNLAVVDYYDLPKIYYTTIFME